MMTLLHSVWSGGGSAAGRRRSLLALGALLALLASVLVWAAPSQAQNESPPVAIASVSVTTAASPPTTWGTATLDGSGSFDPDDSSNQMTYKWEIITEAYSWLAATSGSFGRFTVTSNTEFSVPSPALAARYGTSIEFKLTVNDGDSPAATASTTVTFNLNQGPTADIAVSAMLADPANPDVAGYDDNGNGVKDENAERYPLDGVIDGPGENGNADNEWDIAEGSWLVLDGSGSSDPGGTLTKCQFAWARDYVSDARDTKNLPEGNAGDCGADPQTGSKKIGTDADLAVAAATGETVGLLTQASGRPVSPYYVYYKLTVTDSDGAKNSAVVKIVIHDQPANPVVEQLVPAVSDANKAKGHAVSEEAVPPGSGKYVIAPGSAIDFDLTGNVKVDNPVLGPQDTTPPRSKVRDADGGTLTVSWEGAQADATEPKKASFQAPSTAEEGDEFTITATATDVTGRTGSQSVVLVVAANKKPEAVAPANLTVGDGPDGGDVNPATRKGTGTVKLRGIGFDSDGDPLIFNWTELAYPTWDHDTDVTTPEILDTDPTRQPGTSGLPGAIRLPRKPVLTIDNAFSENASFKVPEVSGSHTVDAAGNLVIPIAFTVIDKWGVKDTAVVVVTIQDDDDVPVADAGPDQQVNSGSFVRLNGSGSSDSDPGDTLTYQWTYVGITTDPATDKRVPISAAEKGYGYAEGKWFPYDGKDADGDDTTDDDATLDGNQTAGDYHPTAGGALENPTSAYPYFDAPRVGLFDSVTLTFRLVVTDSSDNDTDPSDGDDDVSKADWVRVTITDGFYSGQITGPSFCLARSLGGPVTYAFDSDGDDVADVCSLNTTRRATVARQNALETLAALNPQAFKDHLHGTQVDDDPDTDADESLQSIPSQCAAAPRNLGDSAAALAADSCGNGKKEVSSPPKPVDPAKADEFFSGVIDGPSYCANSSLGGPTTYAMDSDGDGVADVCSLPFTRREAVARQNALGAAFAGHAQYANALKAACAALGTTGFGDSPADLAKDACDRPPAASTGTPLPTS